MSKKKGIVFETESGVVLEVNPKGAWFGTSNYYRITKYEARVIAEILARYAKED